MCMDGVLVVDLLHITQTQSLAGSFIQWWILKYTYKEILLQFANSYATALVLEHFWFFMGKSIKKILGGEKIWFRWWYVYKWNIVDCMCRNSFENRMLLVTQLDKMSEIDNCGIFHSKLFHLQKSIYYMMTTTIGGKRFFFVVVAVPSILIWSRYN